MISCDIDGYIRPNGQNLSSPLSGVKIMIHWHSGLRSLCAGESGVEKKFRFCVSPQTTIVINLITIVLISNRYAQALYCIDVDYGHLTVMA